MARTSSVRAAASARRRALGAAGRGAAGGASGSGAATAAGGDAGADGVSGPELAATATIAAPPPAARMVARIATFFIDMSAPVAGAAPLPAPGPAVGAPDEIAAATPGTNE